MSLTSKQISEALSDKFSKDEAEKLTAYIENKYRRSFYSELIKKILVRNKFPETEAEEFVKCLEGLIAEKKNAL